MAWSNTKFSIHFVAACQCHDKVLIWFRQWHLQNRWHHVAKLKRQDNFDSSALLSSLQRRFYCINGLGTLEIRITFVSYFRSLFSWLPIAPLVRLDSDSTTRDENRSLTRKMMSLKMIDDLLESCEFDIPSIWLIWICLLQNHAIFRNYLYTLILNKLSGS